MFSLESLIKLVVQVLIIGVIFGVIHWAIEEINPPHPWKKILRVIVVLVAALIAISVLMSFIGMPIWK